VTIRATKSSTSQDSSRVQTAAKPPSAARANPSARRQQILDTATALFAEKGIVATTVRDVSEQAGILSGSLYHHFASKDEMIAQVIAPVITAQIDEFDRIVSQTSDPTEILRRVIAAEIAQSASNPGVARILQQDEHHIRDFAGLDQVVTQRRAIRVRVESVITRGIATGQFRADCDPRVATMALFHVTLGAYRLLKPLGPYGTEELTHQLTTLILHGLCQV
jgi:TetR/AcrR family transcriptional regulator, cholesterol catabolism regulator